MVHAANGMQDHIHIVATLPPALAVANVIGQLKGVSSYIANRLIVGADTFVWQQEYGVLSISESHLPTVIRYVEHQKQHHAATHSILVSNQPMLQHSPLGFAVSSAR